MESEADQRREQEVRPGTGFRELLINPTPAINTIHVGPDAPSRLVIPVRPGATADTPLPECDTLVNQPCRPAS